MSEIELNVSFPLDDDGFFRRECPLCRREFKVKPTREELQSMTARTAHVLLAGGDPKPAPPPTDDEPSPEQWCPYCGQPSAHDTWWTEEQLAYLSAFISNIAARTINDAFRPFRSAFGGSRRGPVSIEFTGRGLEETEAWISPEHNDLERFALPCCERELKVNPEWKGPIHCFFCGFPHPSAG